MLKANQKFDANMLVRLVTTFELNFTVQYKRHAHDLRTLFTTVAQYRF